MRKFARLSNNTIAILLFTSSLLFIDLYAAANTHTNRTNQVRYNKLHSNIPSLALHQNKTLAFIKNEGQITDQNGKQRSDIDYKLNAQGLEIFVGRGAIHYQWQKHNNAAIPDNNISI